MLKEVFRYSQRIIFQEWSEILSKPLSKFSFQNKGFFGTGSMGLEVTGAGLCHTFITYANEHQLLHRTNTLLSNAIWPFDTRSSSQNTRSLLAVYVLFLKLTYQETQVDYINSVFQSVWSKDLQVLKAQS